MAAENENPRSKYWCFTHHATNNIQGQYELKWPDRLCMFKTQRTAYNITFLVYQEEQGKGDEERVEDRGKFHIQGYLELDKEIERKSLKAAFSKRIHWEKRFGNAEQAEDYCTKEETRVLDGLSGKFGERSTVTQGKRTDIEATLNIIKDPAVKDKKRKLAEECGAAVVKYHKGLETYANWLGVKLDTQRGDKPRDVYIIWGDSGTGKSLMAKKLMKGESCYTPQQNMASQLSFETYRGEKWILLEDYSPGTIGLDALKRMTDTYDCVLPARGSGSSPAALHDGVIITSNYNPAEWVPATTNNQHLIALKRRCSEIIHCQNSGWSFEVSKRTLPPQLPMLEKYFRARGEWLEEPPKKAIDDFWAEMKQEEAAAVLYQEAQVEEDNWDSEEEIEPTQVIDFTAELEADKPKKVNFNPYDSAIVIGDSDDEE